MTSKTLINNKAGLGCLASFPHWSESIKLTSFLSTTFPGSSELHILFPALHFPISRLPFDGLRICILDLEMPHYSSTCRPCRYLGLYVMITTFLFPSSAYSQGRVYLRTALQLQPTAADQTLKNGDRQVREPVSVCPWRQEGDARLPANAKS